MRISDWSSDVCSSDLAGVVLDLMQENGVITQAQAAAADPEDVKLAPEAPQNSVRYFTDWALPQLDTLIDETSEPLEVWTTIDLRMQRAATNALKANAPGGAQGALVRSEEHPSELQSLMRTSYDVFCFK